VASIRPTPVLEGVLRQSAQRRACQRTCGDHHEDRRGGGDRDRYVVGVEPERDDDEDDLDSFQEHGFQADHE
jgi:hypothetical protein